MMLDLSLIRTSGLRPVKERNDTLSIYSNRCMSFFPTLYNEYRLILYYVTEQEKVAQQVVYLY
jgi:hypothetical protein